MNNFVLYRKCPICESSKVRFLYKIDFELFENHPLADGYELVVCKDCSFIYANVKSTQKDFDRYYEYLSRYEDDKTCTGGGLTEYDRNRLNDLSNYIDSTFKNKKIKILDIGCAKGGLLRMLKNKEFYNIVGVDPSLNCVKETVKSVGCDAYKYSLFELNLNSIGKFDLVIFSHVMEHLLDVKLAINILKNILNEDGFIYIECPNAMRYHEIIHAPFQEFNTEHINHFTENSFANLFVNNGFKKITLGNRVFKISSGDKYNAVFGLFQFEDNKCNLLSKDKDIIIAINKYINKSQIIFNEIENRIATLNNSMPVIIYGLGQLSYKILKSNYIKEKNIKYLIDNNPINKGKKLKGVPITSFQEFLESYNRQEDIQIVIMSTIYENVIRNEIIDKLPSVKTIMGFSDIVEKRHNPSSDYH